MEFTLNKLQADDWLRYRQVRLHALRTSPEAFFSSAEDAETLSEQDWRQRLANPEAATWVLTSKKGTDLGLVTVLPYREADARSGDWQLVSMWVAEEARGLGAAGRLVDQAILHATAQGAVRLVLWVAQGNVAAARLYARHGFQVTGLTGNFPAPRHTPEFQMARALTPD